MGALAAIALLGANVLPRNVDWLLHGDRATHLLGWLFLRHASFADAVRGFDRDYLYPVGVPVALTDSIPLVALPLRSISPLLGEHFQYFGLWVVGAFALQGACAAYLLRVLGLAPVERALGAGLFVLFPPMAWRMAAPDLGHASLCLHAPLLLGLAWCFSEGVPFAKRHGQWTALLLAVTAVHVYLAVMVLCLYATDVARHALARRDAKEVLPPIAACLGAVALLAWLGVLAGTRGGPGGYGFYVAPLDTVFDSRGFSAWIPALRAAAPQTEGYGYLGLGASAVVLAAMFDCLVVRRRLAPGPGGRAVLGLACALTLFALSSRVHLGARVVLDAGALTAPIEPVLQSLRATGRFVWIPLYALLAWALRRSASGDRGSRTRVMLGLVLAFQAAEMLPAYARSRPPPSRAWQPVDPAWRASAGAYRHLAVLPARFLNTDCRSPGVPWPVLIGYALLAADNGWSFNGGYSGRPPRAVLHAYCAAALEEARRGVHQPDTVYVFADGRLRDMFAQSAGPAVLCGEVDGARVCVDARRTSPLRALIARNQQAVH
ncbi:MAG: DUF6311 domain-containing protein [Deltaproteobacteria bacterium]